MPQVGPDTELQPCFGFVHRLAWAAGLGWFRLRPGAGGLTKSFLGHLEDLRVCVIRVFLSLAIGMIVVIPFAPRILGMVKRPLAAAGKDPEKFLRVLEVTAGISIAMRIVFWGGLMLSLPFITLFIGRFVFPGLTSRERRTTLSSLGFAVALFIVGVVMGYTVTLPIGLQMMFRISEWVGATQAFVELGNYVSFVLKLLLAFGIAFELPVVVLALGAMGIVTQQQLRDKRRHVIVGLMVLSMVLTPSDPYTMILMAVPLIALYELCIWIIWARERRAKS